MPRISAKTVKEHHENVKNALVDAAEEMLRDAPETELTAAAIAQRAGIARNSIYRYVNSVNDLRRMVIERYMPRWMAAVGQATQGIDDPYEWLEAWVRVNLEQAATSSHGWMRNVVVSAGSKGGKRAAAKEQPNVTIDNRDKFTEAGVDVKHVHQQANDHLRETWEAIAPDQANMYTALTMAQLGVGFRALDNGENLDEVSKLVTHVILTMARAAGK